MENGSFDSKKTTAWMVLDYEVSMFYSMNQLAGKKYKYQLIKNAFVESLILHTRILADLFIGRGHYADDIRLCNLGIDKIEEDPTLKEQIQTLNKVYGIQSDENGMCWIINKMLTHPTFQRLESYDYNFVVCTLGPLLENIINHIYSSANRPLPTYLTGFETDAQ